MSYSENEKNSIIERFSEINNSQSYKTKLSKVVEIYSENEKKLNSMSHNIDKILVTYSDSSIKNIENILLTIKYFDILIQDQLELIALNQSSDDTSVLDDNEEEEVEEKNEEVVVIKKDYSKDALYAWFTSDYNDDTKTILAWEESFVYNGSVTANIEEIEVEKMVFYLESDNIADFKYSYKEAILYVEWKAIQSIGSSDFKIIDSISWELEFDNTIDFIVPKDEIEFRLALIPHEIWYEKLWNFQSEITVTWAKVTEAKWVISDYDITKTALDDWDEIFQISPILLNISAKTTLNESSSASFNVTIDSWNNTKINSSWDISAQLESLKLLYTDTSSDSEFVIYNANNRSNFVTWVKNGLYLEFDLSSLSDERVISQWQWETFSLRITGNNDATVSLTLLRDSITYSIIWIEDSSIINANILNDIDLWTRSY